MACHIVVLYCISIVHLHWPTFTPLMDDLLSLYGEQRWDLIHLAQGGDQASQTGIKMAFQIVSRL